MPHSSPPMFTEYVDPREPYAPPKPYTVSRLLSGIQSAVLRRGRSLRTDISDVLDVKFLSGPFGGDDVEWDIQGANIAFPQFRKPLTIQTYEAEAQHYGLPPRFVRPDNDLLVSTPQDPRVLIAADGHILTSVDAEGNAMMMKETSAVPHASVEREQRLAHYRDVMRERMDRATCRTLLTGMQRSDPQTEAIVARVQEMLGGSSRVDTLISKSQSSEDAIPRIRGTILVPNQITQKHRNIVYLLLRGGQPDYSALVDAQLMPKTGLYSL